jgi:hypothetical protein
MSVGSWEPRAEVRLNRELLERFAEIAVNHPDAPSEGLSEHEIRRFAPVMRLEADHWIPVLAPLDDASLVNLVRFFTVAEMELSGWEGGDRSPVIHIVKILRERGSYPEDLTRWIKARTDNRFLPYGSLLDRL